MPLTKDGEKLTTKQMWDYAWHNGIKKDQENNKDKSCKNTKDKKYVPQPGPKYTSFYDS